jgi:CheY-like chemotaxis protein
MTAEQLVSAPPVLIVDDEALIRIRLALEFETAGFDVREASTAVEALALLQTGFPVSAIVTDLRMPGAVDGRVLVSWIRRHRPGIPVVVASGYPADLEDGTRLDCAAFVSKPYDAAQMVTLLRSLTPSSP